MNKKFTFAVSILISLLLISVVYANGFFQQVFNVNAPNTPSDTVLEQEFQLNGTKLLTLHGLSDGQNGMKEKEVRVEADHIVWGAAVINKIGDSHQGDGNFYVTDGESFLHGRVHNQLREVISQPQMVLGAANYNTIALSGTIQAISVEGWEKGDIVALRFKAPNIVQNMGLVDPGFGAIRFKDNVDHQFSANSTLLLVLDEHDVTHLPVWYEL